MCTNIANSDLVRVLRRVRFTATVALIVIFSASVTDVFAASEEVAQERMLQEIAEDFRATAHLTGRAQMQAPVARAMAAVPREKFVPSRNQSKAYVNRPLSIGHGQTISQPYIVAIMTDLLDLKPEFRVLEIGTGSGYQAAVLASIVAEVFSIEIVEALATQASTRLARLGYSNVQSKVGDGNYGWPEAAPFDAIIVTAGGRLPPRLVEQLKPGGRLVIPLEQDDGSQALTLITKDSAGEVTQRTVLPVRFVPITGAN